MKPVLIFGTNDFAELLYYSIFYNLEKVQLNVIAFIVDDEYYKQTEFCDRPVYKYSEIKKKFPNDIEILVCIGYKNMNEVRKKIFSRLKMDKWIISNYIDPKAIVRTEQVGIGNIIFDGVNIGVKCHVGDGNVFYPGSLLAHHSQIGDFNFFAINSSVAGHVKIGNCCFLGNNSCTKNDIKIMDKTLLGAGCYLGESTEDENGVYVPVRSNRLDKESNSINL